MRFCEISHMICSISKLYHDIDVHGQKFACKQISYFYIWIKIWIKISENFKISVEISGSLWTPRPSHCMGRKGRAILFLYGGGSLWITSRIFLCLESLRQSCYCVSSSCSFPVYSCVASQGTHLMKTLEPWCLKSWSRCLYCTPSSEHHIILHTLQGWHRKNMVTTLNVVQNYFVTETSHKNHLWKC